MKFIRPEDRQPPGGHSAGRLSPAARQAVIEKEKARYILLACDHYTTNEIVELYSHLCPSRGKLWCETCGKWRVKATKPVVTIPDEPLF